MIVNISVPRSNFHLTASRFRGKSCRHPLASESIFLESSFTILYRVVCIERPTNARRHRLRSWSCPLFAKSLSIYFLWPLVFSYKYNKITIHVPHALTDCMDSIDSRDNWDLFRIVSWETAQESNQQFLISWVHQTICWQDFVCCLWNFIIGLHF